MSNVRFESNMDGFREIRYSHATQTMLEALADGVADAANESLKLNGPDDDVGFTTLSQAGKKVKQGRWRVSVTAVTRHAIRHNAIHNTLLRALGGAK